MKNINKIYIVLVILLSLNLHSYACLPDTVDEWISWCDDNDIPCTVYEDAEDYIDETGVCDMGSGGYNESECDMMVSLDDNDSGDSCDSESYLYNVDDCSQQQDNNNEDFQYDYDACEPENADYNYNYCSSLCEESSENYNETACEISNCIDGSPNYSDAECDEGSCDSSSPNYEPDYCASLCDKNSENYDAESCNDSECDESSMNYDPSTCNECQEIDDLLSEIFGENSSTLMAVKTNLQKVSQSNCCGSGYIQRNGNCIEWSSLQTGNVSGSTVTKNYFDHDAGISYLLNMSNAASSMSSLGLDLFPGSTSIASYTISELLSYISALKDLSVPGKVCSFALAAWQTKYSSTADLYKILLTKFANNQVYANKGLYVVHSSEYLQSLYGYGSMSYLDEFYSSDGCLIGKIGH